MLKPGTADWLREALRKQTLSRAALARQLCELDGWRNRKDELCAALARKGLLRLAAELGLPLLECLAFDAATAWQVSSPARYARDAPRTPVGEVLTWDEIKVLWALVRADDLWPGAERDCAPPSDIRT